MTQLPESVDAGDGHSITLYRDAGLPRSAAPHGHERGESPRFDALLKTELPANVGPHVVNAAAPRKQRAWPTFFGKVTDGVFGLVDMAVVGQKWQFTDRYTQMLGQPARIFARDWNPQVLATRACTVLA